MLDVGNNSNCPNQTCLWLYRQLDKGELDREVFRGTLLRIKVDTVNRIHGTFYTRLVFPFTLTNTPGLKPRGLARSLTPSPDPWFSSKRHARAEGIVQLRVLGNQYRGPCAIIPK